MASNASTDGLMDIGSSSKRFKDLYLSGDIAHKDAANNARLLYDKSENLLGNLGTNVACFSLGIGTTSPSAVGSYRVLQIRGGSTANGGLIRLETSDGTSGVARFYAGSGATVLESNTNTPLVFGTNATERMRIDSSGNVGYSGKLFSSNDLTALGGLQLYRDHVTGSCYLFDTTTAPYSGPLIFGTNNAERMRIDASGNVTVGGTTAGNAGTVNLSVGSPGSTVGGLQLWAGTSGSHFMQFGDVASGDGYYRGAIGYLHSSDSLVAYSAGAERMRIDSSGRVGIGTSSPAVPLHITGEGALIDRVSGGDPYIAFQTNGAGTSSIYGGSSTLRFFADAATEAMRITSGGNVGINTTPPAWLSTWRALQFAGNTGESGSIYANAGGTSGAIGLAQNWYYNGSVNVYLESAPASDYGQFSGQHWWRTGTSGTAGTTAVLSERMRLTNAGNLLIGGSSAIYSASQLELHGNPVYQIFRNTGGTAGHYYRIEVDTVPNFYVIDDNSTGVYIQRGNTSWSSLSDETLKENITDIGSVLSTIANYRTARFSWKNDPENTPRIGFIAQDWQTDFPEVISEGKDEKLGMNYTETIPILLKAIQELSTQVTELQAEVAALQGA